MSAHTHGMAIEVTAAAQAPVRTLTTLAALAALLVGVEWIGVAVGSTVLVTCGVVSAYLTAGACGWAAARDFTRGDHLRLAWILNAVMYTTLAVGRTIQAAGLGLPAQALTVVLSALMLAANGGEVGCAVVFAMTWRRTGLPLPGSRRTQLAVGALLVVVSLAVVGPDLVHCLGAAAGGDLFAATMAIGDASDVTAFLLILPVFLTARALSGGSLAWPFALLTASEVCWMLVDASMFLRNVPAVPPGLALATGVLFRTLTCLFSAAAALSQRRAMRG
jgi:hypothetical protein